jgi:hypothetical protein
MSNFSAELRSPSGKAIFSLRQAVPNERTRPLVRATRTRKTDNNSSDDDNVVEPDGGSFHNNAVKQQ